MKSMKTCITTQEDVAVLSTSVRDEGGSGLCERGKRASKVVRDKLLANLADSGSSISSSITQFDWNASNFLSLRKLEIVEHISLVKLQNLFTGYRCCYSLLKAHLWESWKHPRTLYEMLRSYQRRYLGRTEYAMSVSWSFLLAYHKLGDLEWWRWKGKRLPFKFAKVLLLFHFTDAQGIECRESLRLLDILKKLSWLPAWALSWIELTRDGRERSRLIAVLTKESFAQVRL